MFAVIPLLHRVKQNKMLLLNFQALKICSFKLQFNDKSTKYWLFLLLYTHLLMSSPFFPLSHVLDWMWCHWRDDEPWNDHHRTVYMFILEYWMALLSFSFITQFSKYPIFHFRGMHYFKTYHLNLTTSEFMLFKGGRINCLSKETGFLIVS